jgi:hypothetical protein
MARVIGIPLTKGNSESIVAVKITAADLEAAFEGQAVSMTDGSPVSGELVVSTVLGAGSFYGWILDINRCSGYASCLRSAESVYLPANDGAGFALGDAVTIDPASGLIDPAGALITNGVILLAGATQGVNGKTGEAVTDCVAVRIGYAREVA